MTQLLSGTPTAKYARNRYRNDPDFRVAKLAANAKRRKRDMQDPILSRIAYLRARINAVRALLVKYENECCLRHDNLRDLNRSLDRLVAVRDAGKRPSVADLEAADAALYAMGKGRSRAKRRAA